MEVSIAARVFWCMFVLTFLFSQSESSFLYMGPTFIHEKVVLPEYLRARNVLQYEYIKGKLPQQMSDVISPDSKQFCKIFHNTKIFHKTSTYSPTVKFVKCDNVWVYALSHCCFFSDVRMNEILEWGIAPENTSSKIKHGEHDFLAFLMQSYWPFMKELLQAIMKIEKRL